MFDASLSAEDAARATSVVNELLALGFRGALTGSLAIDAQLRARLPKRPEEVRERSTTERRLASAHGRRRALNDLDFVVESFDAIPDAVADRFLLHHVHPCAPEGRTLMQLIDPERAVRVDLFRALGRTLSRRGPLRVETGPLDVVTLEDLIARTTAHVYGRMRAGKTIDPKYAQAFLDLSGLGSGPLLEEAWHDHRDGISCSFGEASSDARRLLALHPELVVVDEYSAVITACERCQNHGRFRCAPPERVVETLGYW